METLEVELTSYFQPFFIKTNVLNHYENQILFSYQNHIIFLKKGKVVKYSRLRYDDFGRDILTNLLSIITGIS